MWAQVCACLSVCACVRVCSLQVCVGPLMGRMLPGGVACTCMCLDVLVHLCMCVYACHASIPLCVCAHLWIGTPCSLL